MDSYKNQAKYIFLKERRERNFIFWSNVVNSTLVSGKWLKIGE